MSILAPRPEDRYGPIQRPGVHAEADGFTAVCECGWIKWSLLALVAQGQHAQHQKKCKAVKSDD